MSRYSSLFFATCVFASALLTGHDSLAQARRLPDDRAIYQFDDDPLTAGMVPNAPRIRVRQKAALETLVQPRTSFVRGLVRSVEAIGGPYPAPIRARPSR